MTRLLEFITALIIVAILALVVGLFLPSSGHIQRSLKVSKDVRHVYDLMNNFRRFPDYGALRSFDPNVQYQQSDDNWYGKGASFKWKSDTDKAGNGQLTISSAKPGYDQVAIKGQATIVWDIDSNWHGDNKKFTLHMKRTGRRQNLVQIDWAYDVDFGWNLIDRYSGLYIHGRPDTLIKYSMESLEKLLASIPNTDYSDLKPHIVKRKKQPLLLVSTQAKRNLTEMGDAADAAMDKIDDAIDELGVKQTGPRIRFTTNYGDKNYVFDVAVPINSDTVTIDDEDYTLPEAGEKKNDEAGADAADVAEPASAASSAEASSVAEPASAASSAKASEASEADDGDNEDKDKGPDPGDIDDKGRLVINKNVRGVVAFGGKALQGKWFGSPAGVPATRKALKSYAATHGYAFNARKNRPYDLQIVAAGDTNDEGEEVAFDRQVFEVYLPLNKAPDETPEQADGKARTNPYKDEDEAKPAKASSSAPAEAASAD